MKLVVAFIFFTLSLSAQASDLKRYENIFREFLVTEASQNEYVRKISHLIYEVNPDSVKLAPASLRNFFQLSGGTLHYILTFEGLATEDRKAMVTCSLYSIQKNSETRFFLTNNKGLCEVEFMETTHMKIVPQLSYAENFQVFNPYASLPYIKE